MAQPHHGGDVYRNVITHDFSINLNPLGMPEAVRQVLIGSVDHWDRYPDPECENLTGALSAVHQVPVEQILCGNGAADLIFQLVYALKPKKALLMAPTFSEYQQALLAVGCSMEYYELKEENGFRVKLEELKEQVHPNTDLVFFCNPNNPTGIAVKHQELRQLADVCLENQAVLVVDECFCDFLEEPSQYSMIPFLQQYPNLFVLKAFTKTYAMAGVRLGYGICADTGLLQQMRAIRQPWSVSIPAQEAGLAALSERDYGARTRTLLRQERSFLKQELEKLGFLVYGSEANYIFFLVPWESAPREQESEERAPEKQQSETAQRETLYEACRRRKLLIRDCSNYRGLGSGYYRICIRTPEENRYLLDQLHQILTEEKEDTR